MKQMLIIFVLTFIAVLKSTEYVVSPQGNDCACGSSSAPFATVKHAASIAKAGDTVTIMPGIYAAGIEIKNSGTTETPIIFQGIRGKNGEYLSIIDGGTAIKDWIPAPEIAPGVWSTAIKEVPGCVTLNGRMAVLIGQKRMNLPRKSPLPNEIHDVHLAFKNTPPPYDRSKLISGFDIMALPENILVWHKQVDWKLKQKQSFWEAAGNMICGWHKGRLYCRFANGKFPEDAEIRVSPRCNGFLLKDKSNVIIRDLCVRGVENSITITGANASNNKVVNNYFLHGTSRIKITNAAHHNIIENNKMSLGYLAAHLHGAGFWKANRMIYLIFKYIVNDKQISRDCAVDIEKSGIGNKIIRNLIYQGLIAIRSTLGEHVEIAHNFVREMSSCGIVSGYSSNMNIHDNFVMDCGINIRIHSFHYAPIPRKCYIYRNGFYQSFNNGMQFFISCSPQYPDSAEQIWFYHNTLIGAKFTNSYAIHKAYSGRKQPVWIYNNLMCQDVEIPPVEKFTGNMFPPPKTKKQNISGNYCIDMKKVFEKTNSAFPSLLLKANSPACKQASKLPALPGISRHLTDIGAIQHCENCDNWLAMFKISEHLRYKGE